MSMTREDVLRELELLPVWKLRAPAVRAIEDAQKVAEVKVVEIAKNSPTLAVTETKRYVLVSDDNHWAFVLPEALSGAAEALFNNILLALQANKTHTATLSNLANVKVIVAMGEIVAQSMLNTSDTIEQLRGKSQLFNSIPLIVSYHPNDLLQDWAFKPKMWDDLCMAKSWVPI